MRRSSLAAAALTAAVTLASGCGEEESAPDIPSEIARSIAGHCKQGPVQAAFPSDRVHADYRALAEESMLIRCKGAPSTGVDANLSAYARFESPERLDEAIGSISLPPAHAEGFCIVGNEAFTTDFWGSHPTCKGLEGRSKGVREPPKPSAVTHRTYTSTSGNAFSLAYKPPGWSNGGTAGSDNLMNVSWPSWTETSALGVGTVGLRGPCVTSGNPGPDCKGQNGYYRAPGRVVLDRPRSCTDQGSILRYFARARFQYYARAGNPFGEPEGWVERTHPLVAYGGKCMLNAGGSFSGMAAWLER